MDNQASANYSAFTPSVNRMGSCFHPGLLLGQQITSPKLAEVRAQFKKVAAKETVFFATFYFEPVSWLFSLFSGLPEFGTCLACFPVFSRKTPAKQGLQNGGTDRNRTSDTRIFSPLLYQLSYRAIREGAKLKGVPFQASMGIYQTNSQPVSNDLRSASESLAEAASLASKTSAKSARLLSCSWRTFSSTVPVQMSL